MRVHEIYFEKAADVPNSKLPVLLYRGVLPSHTAKAETFRERFKGAGWTGIRTDTIYDYTHFHSNAHEVLGIAEGKVTLRLPAQRLRCCAFWFAQKTVLTTAVCRPRRNPAAAKSALAMARAAPTQTTTSTAAAKRSCQAGPRFEPAASANHTQGVTVCSKVRVGGTSLAGASTMARSARPCAPAWSSSAMHHPAGCFADSPSSTRAYTPKVFVGIGVGHQVCSRVRRAGHPC